MLFGHKCTKCGGWWSCQAAPDQGFVAIVSWCPNCLPLVLPRVTL